MTRRFHVNYRALGMSEESCSSSSSTKAGRNVNFPRRGVPEVISLASAGSRRGSRFFQRPRSMSAWSDISRGSMRFDERVRVEYYVNENTFKERLQLYFIKNQRSSLRIRIANLFFKLLTCVLYIVRVIADLDPTFATCHGCPVENKTEFLESADLTEEQFQENPIINWDAILWVNRPIELWAVQFVLAIVSLTEALLLTYLGYKGNIWQQILSFHFILELVTTIPFALTILWPPMRNLFIPVFLNCWLAKRSLENMFNDLHRAMQKSQSALSQQLTILSATLLCLVFTSVCGIQHFQRAGHRHLNLFQSTYYVVVTFSTVGYGDFVPDIWPSQLYMVIMICVALIVLPTQLSQLRTLKFEQLAFTWMERQKLGGSYSSHRAQSEKHVVVCSTTLHADTIMDFLNEFYAHPLLQDYYVVLLSPMELDTTMRMILQVPIWAQRVIYIQGSCLKDGDLARARMNEAEACFILAARNYADKTAADEHTILRSWAVKDFAPSVPQYVQIFRPEHKLHVKFAEHVVCEDEFKYALLANNCTCPGASTLVTLLLHTSRGQEGQQSPEEWHRLYGKCSGNEIYHIVLGDSRFFGEYEGKSFTYASFHSHRKYGVALVGVRPAELPEFYEDTILLNPGPRHIMKKDDTCYYMSITKEENSAFVVNQNQNSGLEPAKEAIASTDNNPHSAISISESKINLKEAATPSSATTTMLGQSSAVTTTTGNHLELPQHSNPNLLSPDVLNQRRGSRRPSILPVPDMFTSSSFSISGNEDGDEAESEDELDDDVPWRSPSEKIAYGSDDLLSQLQSLSLVLSSPDESNHNSSSTTDSNESIHTSPAWHVDYSRIVKGFPPVSPFIGVSPTLCYLLKEKKPLCCLQLAQVCEHCSYRNAKEYQWQNKTIILAADYASNGIYNFIIPLRAHFRSKTSLNPIILLLERRPDVAFLDAISYFPLVYWMLGSIDCLDDLLRAGINLAENVVVVNKELSNSAEEDTLADCNTIVAVQTMFKFFPSIRSITELSQSSNMRFMQFRAHDKYALHLSKMEKVQFHGHIHVDATSSSALNTDVTREKERGSHISYMFRLPFAAGAVFSASMLDTLLYQAFVKDYVITFVRLLLGIDQAPGSGFLTSIKITKEEMWIRTYGRLYQKLCSTTCEIPIGIYRTQDTSISESHVSSSPVADKWRPFGSFGMKNCVRMRPSYDEESATPGSSTTKGTAEAGLRGVTYRPPPLHKSTSCLGGCSDRRGSAYSINLADEARDNHAQQIERAEIANLVRSRMESLNLPGADYDDVSEKRNHLSYVIINPSCDLKLEEGDIVYLVRPSPFSAQKTFERHNSRRKSNISFCSNLAAAAAAVAASGSRRGSGIGLNTLGGVQSMSGPTVVGQQRGRSNSLRIDNDILLRRSSSLRQGLPNVGIQGRRKSSLEEIGISHFTTLMQATNHSNPIKIALNGSIGLEVTPPEEPLPVLGVPCMSGGGVNPSGLGGSALGINTLGDTTPSPLSVPQSESASASPQHLQGTIV
ncbi:potassium channel subfamily T member 2 isoform X9 [Lutzomyia longipalpis]|uniref:potassium channel subfamily T member 2 isoform X9 n=1 Tax=Lutzomyia longipalpis TaxID=7200 RepID=UPI0024837A2F|nr:potassium channel subfamily T member 2 isoform X9 [Lutzomyia longipalpis]